MIHDTHIYICINSLQRVGELQSSSSARNGEDKGTELPVHIVSNGSYIVIIILYTLGVRK